MRTFTVSCGTAEMSGPSARGLGGASLTKPGGGGSYETDCGQLPVAGGARRLHFLHQAAQLQDKPTEVKRAALDLSGRSALVVPPPPQPPMPAGSSDLSQKMNGPAVDYRSTRPTLATACRPSRPTRLRPGWPPQWLLHLQETGLKTCLTARPAAGNSGPVVITPHSKPGAVRQAISPLPAGTARAEDLVRQAGGCCA